MTTNILFVYFMFQSIFLQILNLFFKANILDYQNYISVSSLGCGLGRQGGGHNWQKYFICLFHVSEHVDHFKATFFFLFSFLEIDPSEGPPLYLENSINFIFFIFDPVPNFVILTHCTSQAFSSNLTNTTTKKILAQLKKIRL